MNLQYGPHMPNRQPTDEDWHRLALARTEATVTLWTAGTQHRADVYERLRELGVRRVSVRVGDERIPSVDEWQRSAEWAIAEAFRGGYAAHEIDVRALNEVNLEDGKPGELAAFWRGIRRPSDGVRMVSTPLSAGQPGWQDYWRAFLIALNVEPGGPYPFELVGVHLYAHLLTTDNLELFRAPGLPLAVTEFGHAGLGPAARAEWTRSALRTLAAAGAEYAVQFIVGGQTYSQPPEWDPSYRMSDDEARLIASRDALEVARPSRRDAMLYGIDISNHQARINWDVVASSVRLHGQPVRFAIAKSSGDENDGDGDHRFIDGWFSRNWPEMKRVGLRRGAYHYACPSRVTPAESVTLFEQVIKANGGLGVGDMVALDLEDPDVPVGVSLAAWTAEWLDLAERVFGVPPILYTGNYYMAEHDLYHGSLARYPLWLASYQATKPPPPKGFDRIAIWQYDVTAANVVPGVPGRCDVNRFDGADADLAALGRGNAEPTQPIDPPPPPPESALDFYDRAVWGPMFAAHMALRDQPSLDDQDLSYAILRLMRMHKRRLGAEQ